MVGITLETVGFTRGPPAGGPRLGSLRVGIEGMGRRGIRLDANRVRSKRNVFESNEVDSAAPAKSQTIKTV